MIKFDDVVIIANYNLWPRYPFLCFVRKSTELGLLFDGQKYGILGIENTIFLCSIPDVKEKYDNFVSPFVENCPKINYKDVRELLSDGWEID